MKKRICTWLLAVSLLASLLTLPVKAASVTAFSDVTDSYTATAVETLRLMGVLDGYSDGTFRPGTVLNRAQFCKMAVYAMGGSGELGRYTTVTIFPDVKQSHWAASYINMAAKKGIISGYADGTFQPGQSVTTGQAVTILMRGLGYEDASMGGVWPQSYMAEAQTCGLLDGTGITSAYAGLTRAQAARLFLNLFEAKQGGGKTVLFAYDLSAETTLLSVDGGKGTITTAKETKDMAHPVNATSLVGSKGKLVSKDGKALTFLPSTGSAGVSNAAVIIGSSVATSGLDSLAGSSGYSIYKNGLSASAGDLQRYDVVTYAAATHSLLACDTRVSVYYEDCTPSPSAPTTITVLGGTELNVLPTAVESLAKFKPGDQMILLLTADGQVAGAVESTGSARANAVALVSSNGSVQMICGGGLLTVKGSASGSAGKVVSLSGSKSGLSCSAISGGASGALNVREKKLGGKNLADNVMIFDGGAQVALSELNQSGVNAGRIAYARTNWRGEVDLIVLNNDLTGDVIYGRVIVNWSSGKVWVPDVGHEDEDPKEGVNGTYQETSAQTISVETAQKTYGPIKSGNLVSTGDYAAVTLNKAGTQFTSFDTMTELRDVSDSAWVGDTAVNFGGRTYEVASDVQCYNADSGKWMTDLDTARRYGGTINLYVHNGVVRIVEVKA